jgi:hypothetical protein
MAAILAGPERSDGKDGYAAAQRRAPKARALDRRSGPTTLLREAV